MTTFCSALGHDDGEVLGTVDGILLGIKDDATDGTVLGIVDGILMGIEDGVTDGTVLGTTEGLVETLLL